MPIGNIASTLADAEDTHGPLPVRTDDWQSDRNERVERLASFLDDGSYAGPGFFIVLLRVVYISLAEMAEWLRWRTFRLELWLYHRSKK